MKHINNLILKNFQQWKNGNIQFKEGLNIIVGNTESGKSTLFRAIGSILTGKMPEDYIRKGTKGCEVEIQFNDGTIFKRSRSKKDNIANANGKIFERVGKEIPFEYFKELGNTNIKFGTKELSLCSYSQFEPHFFITLSDYDKSKLIGTICGIDIVDKLMDSINKDIRSNNSNIKFLEEQINLQKPEKEQKETEFNKLQEKCNLLSECYINIQDKFKTLNRLSELSQDELLLQNSINTIKNDLNTLKLKISEFDKEKVNKFILLYQLKEKLKNLNNNINEIQNKQKNLKIDINFDNNKVNLLSNLIILRQKLIDHNRDKKIYIKLEDNFKQNIEELTKQKQELLKNYDRCPLCGGVL